MSYHKNILTNLNMLIDDIQSDVTIYTLENSSV